MVAKGADVLLEVAPATGAGPGAVQADQRVAGTDLVVVQPDTAGLGVLAGRGFRERLHGVLSSRDLRVDFHASCGSATHRMHSGFRKKLSAGCTCSYLSRGSGAALLSQASSATRRPRRRASSATITMIVMIIAPITAADSSAADCEYSSIRIDSGRVAGVTISTIVLMSRSAAMNTSTKMLTSIGRISGSTMRRKVVIAPAPQTRDDCSSS